MYALRNTLNCLVTVALLALCAGCRVVRSAAELPGAAVNTVAPGKRDKGAVDPVDLQQQLMRFADEFAAGMAVSAEELRRGTNRLDRGELQKWKLSSASSTLAIASGQNDIVNLLDMIVMVTLTRMAVEQHWLPQVYGDSARPMLDMCRNLETKVWQLATPILKPGQTEELRRAIQTGYEENPDPEMALHTRALGFASRLAQSDRTRPAEQPDSVFNLLKIDPLAGLDPAARELAKTRLFAERALFMAQRMPLLIRWQTELLFDDLTEMPASRQLLSDADRLARSTEAFAKTSEQFPALVNNQREAAIKQIFAGLATERTNLLASLASEEKKFRELFAEMRQTLNAGTEMATSVNAAVQSLDAFVHYVSPVSASNSAPQTVSTNDKPFDVLDYGKAAGQVGASARDLNALLVSLNQNAPQVARLSQQASTDAQRVLDRAFWQGVALIVILLIGSLGVGLAYRVLAGRWSAGGRKPPTQNS
ncbi:MAG: hypothetical protein ABI651_21780, partial [Verrucomicrobiota bacterium]